MSAIHPDAEARALEIRTLLLRLCQSLGAKHGGGLVLDGLLSIWLDMYIMQHGEEAAGQVLRRVRTDLPRLAKQVRSIQARGIEGS